MKISNIKINNILPLIPLKYIADVAIKENIFPIIISADNYVINGHKRLKNLLKNGVTSTDVMVLDREKYEAYNEANANRALTIFEQYTLLKNGQEIKVSGIIPRDYDVLDKIELFTDKEITTLIEQNINSKNIISLLFLSKEKQDIFFEIINRLPITNNELRSVLECFVRIKLEKLMAICTIEKKAELITELYQTAKPFIFRNNEIIKKINTSLPNRTTIRENTSFELGDFELALSFSSEKDLQSKVEKMVEYIATDNAKTMLNELGE